MDGEAFRALFERRVAASRQVLAAKSAEYSTDADKLHNFKECAKLTGQTHPQACAALMAKHLVSLIDMANDTTTGRTDRLTADAVDEKAGDALNYIVLLEACLREWMDAGGGA